MNSTSEVKNRVPLLKWGEWKDNTYCGCVAALLNAAGIETSYEEVMGLSGVCYQAIMRDDWDPSSQMPQNGVLSEKNVGDAFGIAVYSLSDTNLIYERAKESIDAGFPVLMVAGRAEPEWTLACKYVENDDGCKFFGRTYFDCQSSAPLHNTSENDDYLYFDGFPGWYPPALTRFYNAKCEPISKKQALKVSLETSLKMFKQPSNDTHKFGYDAYEVLIRGLRADDDVYNNIHGFKNYHCDKFHIGSMQDARRAAYVYLSSSAVLLSGNTRLMLEKVAGLYKKMLDNLISAVPYEKTTAAFIDSDPEAQIWDKEQRDNIADALTENIELEKQARIIISDLLTVI